MDMLNAGMIEGLSVRSPDLSVRFIIERCAKDKGQQIKFSEKADYILHKVAP
jgi:hypothetical protein